MSKWKYRIIASVIILVMLLTGLGISGLFGRDKGPDSQKVIAEVNGEKILKGELLDIYEQVKSQYGVTEDDEKDSSKAEYINNLKLSILDSLIYDKLIAQNASKAGFSVTDSTLEEAKKGIDDMVALMAENLKNQAGEEAKGDEDYLKQAQEYVDIQLQAFGMTTDEYIKIVAEQLAIEDFMNEVTKDIEATDEEVEEYYNTQLPIQKEDALSAAYSDVQLFKHPQVRVKHILISLSEDQQQEYRNLVNEGKEEEAKSYLDEKLKAINPKAMEVLNKAKNGEDFEKLIEEYGEDPGMVNNEEGYLVSQDGQFVKEFEEASFSLKEGEISELVPTYYGYHIIKAYERIPEKEFSLEEKKDEIKSFLDNQKKSEKWNSLLEQWKAEADITRYDDRV